MEIIGEGVKNIPDFFREKHPEIPWKDMAGMRDRLIHEKCPVYKKGMEFQIKEGYILAYRNFNQFLLRRSLNPDKWRSRLSWSQIFRYVCTALLLYFLIM